MPDHAQLEFELNGMRVLPLEAAAVRLDCSIATLRRLIASGAFTPIRAFGRTWIEEAEVISLAIARRSR